MSKSYKKQPFQSICGGGSAKKDKIAAHRGERRKHSRDLYHAFKHDQLDDFIPPRRLECHHNDVWEWSRDGHQRYCGLTARDWERYVRACEDPTDLWNGHFSHWPPLWYLDMMRK